MNMQKETKKGSHGKGAHEKEAHISHVHKKQSLSGRISRHLSGSRKRYLIAGIVILGVILLAFLAFELYLYFNNAIGNDTIVSLTADRDSVTLKRGETANITFKASVQANVFCTANCTAVFEDIGRNKVVESTGFMLAPGMPVSRSYALQATRLGTGQELYRFSMECISNSTLLCHTSQEPTTRSVLVAMDYQLPEDDLSAREQSLSYISIIRSSLEALLAKEGAFKSAISLLEKSDSVEALSAGEGSFRSRVLAGKNSLISLRPVWDTENYSLLLARTQVLMQNVSGLDAEAQIVNSSTLAAIEAHNKVIFSAGMAKAEMLSKRGLFITDRSILAMMQAAAFDYNAGIKVLNLKVTLAEKERAVSETSAKIAELNTNISESIRNEALSRELDTMVELEALCRISGTCINDKGIDELSAQAEFELEGVCNHSDYSKWIISEVTNVFEALAAENSSLDNSSDASAENASGQDSSQEINITPEIIENISISIKNLRGAIRQKYLAEVPDNCENSVLIRKILSSGIIKKKISKNTSSENPDQVILEITSGINDSLRYLYLKELGPGIGDCTKINISLFDFPAPLLLNMTELAMPEQESVNISFYLPEQVKKCCIFKRCGSCCENELCRNDPNTYPVVLLHGHAVNKDISYEFSLEGFDRIQKQFEEDGYLSAGTINVYTPDSSEEGVWGLANVPLTIRSSYYYDYYQGPGSFVAVQAKSENIDTYAVRLKDVIEQVKYKTGKPKVKIVAYSMGGLVARRYIQIFGTDSVEVLVLFGTPNHGISGDVSSLCGVTGSDLECRDMKNDSLFINKLNSKPIEGIPVYNVYATGCKMSNGMGDGIVLESSARLDWAKNTLITGTCRGTTQPLHTDLLDTGRYPQAYEAVKRGIEEK
jgi:hypothetical protein